MSDGKLCHKTIELDFDDSGEAVTIGAPCIKEKCEAWNTRIGICNLSSASLYIYGVGR